MLAAAPPPGDGRDDLGQGPDPAADPPSDGIDGDGPLRPDDPLDGEADRGPAYEPTRAQQGAALVTAAGLVLLIAGTVMRLTAGRCVFPRTTSFGTSCEAVVAEPWFGVLAFVTVGAAAVGAVLGIRDLSSGRRPP